MSGLPVVRLIVSIDTEEDNWVPVQRDVTTRNIAALTSLQHRFETLGVRPTYFTNYQVVLNPASAGVIRDIHDGGRAEVAAHLHPWNTPPLAPTIETMLLNLSPELQAAKIAAVTRQLYDVLGVMPRAFRAGRFGLGPDTVRALIDAGYTIDSSVTPFYSWKLYDRGPSHVGAPLHMYRLSGNGDVRRPDGGPLVEVPLSSGYNRWHPRVWPQLRSFLDGGLARRLRLAGIAARLDLARSVMLSPEIHSARHMRGLAGSLIDGGLPFLHVFWHSPSMTPGLSPFCRSTADVERLMVRFELLLALLERRVSLRFVTVSEAVAELGDQGATDTTNAVASQPVSPVSVIDVPGERGRAAPELPRESGASGEANGAARGTPVGSMGRHAAIYLAGILVSRAVGFVMLPFYTRYLTPADYGVMQLLDMTLDIIAIVAGTRIASGIHRYYFEAHNDADRKAVLSTAFSLLAVSFLIFGALTGILAVPITVAVFGSGEHAGLLRIASVTLGLQSLLNVPFGIIQLWKRSVLLTALTTTKLIMQVTLNIVFLAVVGLGVKGVFLSTLVANLVIGTIVTTLVIRQIGLRVSRTVMRSLLRYGLPLVGTQFATFFVTYGDRYFLRVSGDATAVGLYALAYQFGFIVVTVGYSPFAMIWEPTRFQVAKRPDRDELYSRAFVIMNVFLLIATMIAVLFVRDFIVVMSDAAYHSAYRIVPVILMAYVFQSWSSFHEVGILVRARTGYVTLANWVAALVALVGYALLVPRWLGWGAAVATLLAFLTRWIITYIVAQRLLPVRYAWAPVWRLVALSALFAIAGIAMPHPSVPASLAMRSALLAAYLWSVWHIGVVRAEEKTRLLTFVRSPRSAIRALVG